jgi:hypothetical protein
MLVRWMQRQHQPRVDEDPNWDYEGEPYRAVNLGWGISGLMYQVSHLPIGDWGLSMAGYRGSLLSNVTVELGLAHIRDRFDPRGKLILYGYSGGAFNALEICQQLDTMSFDYWTGQLGGTGGPMSRRVKVDYLVTVDPSRILLRQLGGYWPDELEQGRSHSALPREVPGCVLYFDNWYQTYDTVPVEGADWGFRGEWINHPHLQGRHNWRVTNDRFRDRHTAHQDIVEAVWDDVLERFRRFLVPGHQPR